jgi:hypothetical protein
VASSLIAFDLVRQEGSTSTAAIATNIGWIDHLMMDKLSGHAE